MKPYTVYFAIGDKKLRCTVMAHTRTEAENTVQGKLRIIRTVEEKHDRVEDMGAMDRAYTAIKDIIEDLTK